MSQKHDELIRLANEAIAQTGTREEKLARGVLEMVEILPELRRHARHAYLDYSDAYALRLVLKIDDIIGKEE